MVALEWYKARVAQVRIKGRIFRADGPTSHIHRPHLPRLASSLATSCCSSNRKLLETRCKRRRMGCASSVPVAPPRVQEETGDGAISSKDKGPTLLCKAAACHIHPPFRGLGHGLQLGLTFPLAYVGSAMPQPDSPLAANDTIKAGVVTASPASSVADEKEKEAKEKAKSKTARARRLSYVQNTEGQIAERAGSQGQAILSLLSKNVLAIPLDS